MARRIEHRSTSEWSAHRVHEARTDRDYLRDRLRELGGSGSELLGYNATEDGARFQLRQEVRAGSLPAVARSMVGGDLKIDRTESWRRESEGQYAGEIAAEVAGAPCAITGSMWLRDLPEETGSELLIEGTVEVNVPLVGGKLEDFVVEQLHDLLASEDRFTTDWLAQR